MSAVNQIKDLKEREKEGKVVIPELRPPLPKDMMIELTNACNNKCVFCANHRMTRKTGFMKEALLNKLLEESYSLGVTDVGFYTIGEPFLSVDLPKYIAKAKTIGFTYVYISTNGILAVPNRAQAAIDAGLDSIKFSINAGTVKTYTEIHGTDNFHNVFNNVKFISEYRKKTGLPFKIYITFVVTKNNQHERLLFKEMYDPLVDGIYFNLVDNQHSLDNEALRSENRVRYEQPQPPCAMLFNRFHITYEGYLTACCSDYQNYLVTSNLNNSRLKDAWHNETFVDIRSRHLKNEIEGLLCYNCLYNKRERIEPLSPQYATIYDACKRI